MRGTPSLTTLYKECVNPVNEYIWLDKLHPTSGVHQLIAKGVKRVSLFGFPGETKASELTDVDG